MPNSPLLGFAELAESQAIPATTANLIHRYLEAMGTRAIVLDDGHTDPTTATTTEGTIYLVPSGATGAWTGWADSLVLMAGGTWRRIQPREGLRAYVLSGPSEVEYDGAAWVPVASGGGGGGASTTQDDEMICGFIAAPSNKSYTIALKMAHPGTITETTTKSASGTCTATFKINSTALGGSANSVSSAEQSQSHVSSNAFLAGDDIVLTVSSNSSCADMSFSIKYTRTLD